MRGLPVWPHIELLKICCFNFSTLSDFDLCSAGYLIAIRTLCDLDFHIQPICFVSPPPLDFDEGLTAFRLTTIARCGPFCDLSRNPLGPALDHK
jgi:hypothetical protein